MERKCNKEKEIDKATNAIFGNGKKGLITLVQGMSDQIGYLTKSVDSIKTDLKVLLHFQTQIETREESREVDKKKLLEIEKEHLINKRWRIGLIIVAIISLLRMGVSLILV